MTQAPAAKMAAAGVFHNKGGPCGPPSAYSIVRDFVRGSADQRAVQESNHVGTVAVDGQAKLGGSHAVDHAMGAVYHWPSSTSVKGISADS